MMNEKFMELADQLKWESDVSYGELMRFAALIVKECAEVCKKQEYDYWRSSEDQDFTPQDCANAIEQHFGMK